MKQLSLKAGDSIVVTGGEAEITLKVERIGDGSAELTLDAPEELSVKRGRAGKPAPKDEAAVRRELRDSMAGVLSSVAELDSAASQEILTQFVSDLFYTQAQKRQREERLVKQTQGIAAAKARGVRFGPRRKPLPENFEEYCEAWRGGQMSLREAAKACGMSHSSFYQAVGRAESRH